MVAAREKILLFNISNWTKLHQTNIGAMLSLYEGFAPSTRGPVGEA